MWNDSFAKYIYKHTNEHFNHNYVIFLASRNKIIPIKYYDNNKNLLI